MRRSTCKFDAFDRSATNFTRLPRAAEYPCYINIIALAASYILKIAKRAATIANAITQYFDNCFMQCGNLVRRQLPGFLLGVNIT
jgi:hypothetical protein